MSGEMNKQDNMEDQHARHDSAHSRRPQGNSLATLMIMMVIDGDDEDDDSHEVGNGDGGFEGHQEKAGGNLGS